MKRLSVIATLFNVGILVFTLIFEASATSPAEAKRDKSSIKFHDEIGYTPIAIRPGDMAVPVICLDMKIAPIFDAAGAVVSDPTGTMLNPSHPGCTAISMMGADVKIAPVFDATGAVVSDPTGTILNADQSVDMSIPVTGMDVKIAPIFDAAGAVVSDPTGTILSVINP